MVEKTRRTRVRNRDDGTGAFGDDSSSEWEVFLRDDAADPLRHVGSVVAGSPREAHEHASRLFGWYAHDVWVCPGEAVARYSVRADDGNETSDEETGVHRTSGEESEGRCSPGRDAATDDEPPEPRVYEETEGTPQLRNSR